MSFTIDNTSDFQQTVLPNGNLLVVWIGTESEETRVRAQVYDAAGTPVGDQIVVSDVSDTMTTPTATVLADGNFAFSWSVNQFSANGRIETKTRVIEPDGTPVSGVINANTLTTGNQSSPGMTALDDGSYIVTYYSGRLPGDTEHDGSDGAIRAQRFDATGNKLGDEFIVNTATEGNQQAANVTALDGGYVVTFISIDTDGSSGVRARLFANDGTPAGDEFVVSDATGGQLPTLVKPLAGGGFAIVWSDADNDTINGRLYDADGQAVGEEFSIEQEAGVNDGYVEDFLVLPDGRMLVAWSYYDGTSAGRIFAQYLDADGNPQDTPFQLAETTTGSLASANIDLADDDTVYLTWAEFPTEGGMSLHSTTFEVEEPVENAAPEDIELSSTTVSEAARAGSVVGVLSATDPDGDEITWSLVTGEGDNNDFFDLRENDDGTVSVVLKAPLDFEGLSATDGAYDLVVKATDTEGNETTQTISIQSVDELMLMAAAPTGKNYVSVMENVDAGQKIGFFVDFDDRTTPLTATLIDDADGKFDIKTSVVDGVTRYYLIVNGELDHETEDLHSVTVRTTDAEGNSQDKTYDIHVLDAAEKGDEARGRITIDAATALAAANGGVNWDTYIDAAYKKVEALLPSGVTFAPTTSNEYVYTYDGGDGLISLKGSDLAYWWSDPESGEDVHVVGGTMNSLTFGNNDKDVVEGSITNPELSITGLDLTNGSELLARIYGEANAMAAAWMHGSKGNSPAEIEFVKALLASYAQDFVGSRGNDVYTGTVFDDTVDGGKGKDVLRGDAGDDLVTGGAGVDKLYGGAGADSFVFLKGDTGKKSSADTIYDFKTSQGDTIDLSDWDANSKKAGDQDFKFIGSETFHGKAGELHVVKDKSDTWIEGDTNGDRKADFVIHLDDAMKLKIEHFEL